MWYNRHMRTQRKYKCANPDCTVLISRRKCCSIACSTVVRSTKKEHTCEYKYCNKLTKNPRFCSITCSNFSRALDLNVPREKPVKEAKNCMYCDKLLVNSCNKYCNSVCQQRYAYKRYIEDWLAGSESGTTAKGYMSQHVRKYIYSLKGHVCWECGWDKKHPADDICPVQIEHIDGRASNNHISNLKVLCPNCHSLTLTFGSRNKNSTRTYRYNK